MRYLYLVRHAKSSWEDPDWADEERPLLPKGKKDIRYMGKRLATYGFTPDLMVASPAQRTRSTARRLAKKLGYKRKEIVYDERIYEATMEDLQEVCREMDADRVHIVLVGHNPSLTTFAQWLGAEIESLPTSGIVCAVLNGDDWKKIAPAAITIAGVWTPKLLKKLEEETK